MGDDFLYGAIVMLKVIAVGCCLIVMSHPAGAESLGRRLGRAMVMGAGAAAGSMAMHGAVEAASRPSPPPAAGTYAAGQQPYAPRPAPQAGQVQNPFSRP